MADVSVTAANVAPGTAGTTTEEQGVAGASITAGQVVYKEASTGTFKLADANSATAEVRSPYGVALNTAASGQPIRVHIAGTYTVGGTVTVGGVYVLSATAGGIAPVADLASGWYTTVVGVGITATTMKVQKLDSLVAVP